MPPVIHTVGHSDRSLERFTAILTAHGITFVADVRRWPVSRRHPHFDRDALRAALADAGIEYVFEGKALGGRREPSPDSDTLHGALPPDYRGYAAHMATPAFRAACDRLVALAERERVALLCAERDPVHCHRSLIADHLVLQGREVIHLLDEARTQAHRPHPGARLSGNVVVYDRGTQTTLEGF